jgi:hypothetical protein
MEAAMKTLLAIGVLFCISATARAQALPRYEVHEHWDAYEKSLFTAVSYVIDRVKNRIWTCFYSNDHATGMVTKTCGIPTYLKNLDISKLQVAEKHPSLQGNQLTDSRADQHFFWAINSNSGDVQICINLTGCVAMPRPAGY